MKTIRLFPLLAAAALMAAGCEKPENTNEEGGEETVAVESITLDSSISEGVSLVEGETLSIADLVTVLPENATDRTVSYSSSDEAVATVSEAGVITAVAEGAATISVSAGEKTVKFIITVSAAVQTVDITSITFSADEQEYELAASTEGIDLNSLLTVEPAGYTEGINFASSDPAVASVDENGKMTLHKLSEGVKITASAAGHSDIKDEITIKVYSIPGDYPRFEGDEDGEEAAIEGENWYWTMTFSDPLLTAAEQKLINGRNNSLTAMLDGRKIVSRSGATDDAELSNGTAFCVKNRGTAADHEAWFIIDMGQERKVNYFRISNISTHKDDLRVRFKKFNEISGSNSADGPFTTIIPDIDFTAQQNSTETRESGNISIPESNYRYLKFTFKGTECFGPDGNSGTTAQIEEFYLGCDEKTYTE